MAELTKLDIAKIIISERISSADLGIFNSRNIFGDPMTTIYRGNHLTIDICYPYAYFEVFGLSEKEFEELVDFYEIKREEYSKSLCEEED